MGLKQEWVVGMCDRDVPKGVSDFMHGVQQYYLINNSGQFHIDEATLDELAEDEAFRESYLDRVIRFDPKAASFEESIQAFNDYVVATLGSWPDGGVTISMDW